MTLSKKQIYIMNHDVLMMDVLDYLGCETERHGGRQSFLCPFHGDEHFGSCFIMKDSPSYGYCFVCGRRISPLDMLEECSNDSHEQCLITLAHLSGHEDYLNQSEPIQTIPPSPLNQLTNWQLDLIGLHRIPKYIPTMVSVNQPTENPNIKTTKISASDTLQYWYQHNFAKDMEQQAPEIIDHLIQQKCIEKLWYIYQLRQGIQVPMSSELSRWEWKMVQDGILTVHDWNELLDMMQDEIETIYYEHGGTLTTPQEYQQFLQKIS